MKKVIAIIALVLVLVLALVSCGNEETVGTEGLAYYPLPDGTYAVGAGTTEYLDEIVVPETYNEKNVTQIKDSAFAGATNLKTITLPGSITSIGNYAFISCTSLMSVVIPDGVTSIGYRAFYDCSSLMSVVIPDSVTTSIGEMAFWHCSNLTSVVIPEGVTSIGDYAFEYCSSLTSIKYRGTEAQWNAISKGYEWDYRTGSYTITYNYTGE